MPLCSVALGSYSSNSSTVLLDSANPNKVYVWRSPATDFSTADADCKSLATWPGDKAYMVSYDSYAEVRKCAIVAVAFAAAYSAAR